ncbi:MAG TPA: thiamine pyrophosphate-dependent enzyme [Burkholderiales bacterium]|nr:thiamine pyrophosphate-dependent enzyme [Burkholderiales bacterium]
MKRLALAKLVKERLRADDLVVCGLGATEAAFKEAAPVNPTYYASDPMGLWPSIALGLALAQRERRVTLLAGDGDLLMNLQVLATIATAPAPNFRIVVFHNGAYSSTGGQPLTGKPAFAAIARGTGFERAAEARGEAETARALDELFAGPGPALLDVWLEDEPCPPAPPGPWSQVEERTLFMRALQGLSRGSRSG